ncbi:fimbrial protein [Ralstonia insidiosa]|uniref:fimbrial protein n=1 Tax=Ralstonia insidiosa TaxID=190721 RepID=UPI000CEDAEE5|nr:type 1 fimbrial protein [Ralstonia insidiosa]
MKSIKFASAIALAAGVLVMGNAQAQAANGGTIRITGAVTDATCTITGGAGTDGGTSNVTVALDPVAATSLTAAGNTANHKPFSLIIGGPGQGSCVDGKVARLSFNVASPRVDAATGTLTNALVGQAGNTNIQMTNGTAAGVINLASPANGVDSPAIADNTATINLGAQYYATGAATPGLVDTSVQYGVTYN